MNSWYIGDVLINNRIVLAPMAGVCNSSFRKIIKQMGAGLIYTEMISAEALVRENKKTLSMLDISEDERPVAVQIFGENEDVMIEASKYLCKKYKFDILDINMGCPVPKIAIRSNSGSALLKDPAKIYRIVKGVVDAVTIPVTVKIRSGWDSNSINAPLVAKVCEKAGASAICVHARSRSQGYSGKADWNIIKLVKMSVSIPVIGNGDVTSPLLAKKMLDETSCDAVMIGRGSLGNPWLIRNSVLYLDNKSYTLPSDKEKIDMCIKHLNLLVDLKSEKNAVLEIRNHVGWYLKGIKGSSEIKKKIYQMSKVCDILHILNEFKEELDEEGI